MGRPKAPTIVFVHGVRDHGRTWDDLLAHFVDDYHIVVPDLRGHGDSEWVQGSGYDYLDYLYDLYQLIVQNDFGPVVLVGHSLGGAITSFFAGAYPELVSKLVVIEGIGLWQRDVEDTSLAEKLRNWVETTQSLADRQPKRYDSLEAAYQRMQQANPQLIESRHTTLRCMAVCAMKTVDSLGSTTTTPTIFQPWVYEGTRRSSCGSRFSAQRCY